MRSLGLLSSYASASSEDPSIESFDVVVVEINYTPDFIIDSLRRLRSLGITRKVFRVAKHLSVVVCSLIALLMIFQGAIAGVILWGVFAAFLALSGAIDQWLTKRNLLRAPFINEKVRLEFSNAGLRATSPSQDVKFTWSVFTKLLRFDDGFLLMQGPGMCNWIPYHAILGEKGPDQLAQLVDSKIGSSEDRRTMRSTSHSKTCHFTVDSTDLTGQAKSSGPMKLRDTERRVLRAMARVSAECTSRKTVVVLRYALLEVGAWDTEIEDSLCNDGKHPIVAEHYNAIRRLIHETNLSAGAGDLVSPAGPRYTECWITEQGFDWLGCSENKTTGITTGQAAR